MMAPATKGATLAPPRRKPLTELDGVPLLKLTVEQFQQMYKVGILKPTPKVELIEGYLVEMEKVDPPHALVVGFLMDLLMPLIPRGWHLRMQSPVALPDSQPLPDGVIATGARADYPDRHPRPGEITLLVEVSDTTLDDDQGRKLRLYARNRIPVYWIVNIPERRLEVYTRPVAGQNPRYRGVQTLAETDSVSVTIGGTVVGPVAVADLLPPA